MVSSCWGAIGAAKMNLGSREEEAIQRWVMIPNSFISGNVFRLWAETLGYTWSDPLRGILLKEREICEAYDMCERLKWHIRNLKNPKVWLIFLIGHLLSSGMTSIWWIEDSHNFLDISPIKSWDLCPILESHSRLSDCFEKQNINTTVAML